MEKVYRRRIAGQGKRAANRRKIVTGKGADGDRRRLKQLLVSLALFLLVFAGRGVFPEQAALLKQLVSDDLDFKQAVQSFGQALAQGERFTPALKQLSELLLGTREETPDPGESDEGAVFSMLPTSRAPDLRQYEQMGLLEGRAPIPRDEGPSAPPSGVEPTPQATPTVVTAVAQATLADGTKLPSNVSFQFYELGLEETVCPVMGAVSSGFGYRTSPMTGKKEFHLALDIVAEKGTAIGAFADGVVEYIGESDEFGLYFKLRHDNNVTTFYAHCSELLVRKGMKVTCGQTVARVGNSGNATGAHLHLTIEKDNIRLDPAYYVDPN